MVIKCEDLCKDCQETFLKNPFNLGDYDSSGVLLRYCPVCGKMLPLLSVDYDLSDEFSNSLKRRIGVRVAKVNKLDYIIMNTIIKDLKEVTNQKEFVMRLSKEIRKNFEVDLKKEDIIRLTIS